jgi:hypothetical protein
MNTLPRHAVAVMAAVFVFGIASLALAQSPPRGTDSREVMIHECWVKALQHYPYKGGDDSKDLARNATYKTYMFDAGKAP